MYQADPFSPFRRTQHCLLLHVLLSRPINALIESNEPYPRSDATAKDCDCVCVISALLPSMPVLRSRSQHTL